MIKKRIMAAVIALLLIVNVSPMSLVAYAESDMGTEEVTLSASPDTLTCIITFDMCGHGESIEAVEAEAGACIDKPNDPEAEGFIFDGWYVDKEYTTAWVFETNAVIGDTVLYARWIAEEQIQVSLDTQLFAQYTGERQESLTELTPEPTLESTPEPTPESTPESTPEPTPEPSPIIIYTVTFNSLGHGTVIESIAVEAGTLLTKPDDPSEAGFDFEGWYADQEHTSIWNFETDTVNENITLFAKWSEAEQASEDSSAEQETAEAACPAFGQSRTVNGVTVHVSAPEGVFPMNASLSVELVPVEAQPQVDAAVETERESGRNVAVSYTFDIKVLDPEGNELQPGEGQSVNVSFTLTEVANENLTTEVYHVSESEEGGSLSAEVMKVETNEATATVTTEGFSYYTVEFTYGDKQYVLSSEDSPVELCIILDTVGLTGTINDVSVSDESLLGIVRADDADTWLLYTLKPFETEERLKTVIDGVEYVIILTDAIIPDGGSGSNNRTFARSADLATVTIDPSKLTKEFVNLSESTFSSGITYNNGKVTADLGSVDLDYEKVFDGFTIVFSDAVIMSDGSREDLIFSVGSITVVGRDNKINPIWEIWPHNETILLLNLDYNQGNSYPSITAQGSATYTMGSQKYGYNQGFRMDDALLKIEGKDSSHSYSLDTYFYTVRGLNINRRPNTGSFGHLHGASSNYSYTEAARIDGGSSDGNIYVVENYATYMDLYNGNTLVAKTSAGGNNFYENGFAVLGLAQSGVNVTFWQSAPRDTRSNGELMTTDFFFLSDEITHNITSSSGYYGMIEVWKNGQLGTSGDGNWLYGGRYVPGEVDEKRMYDVPNGKKVTYKLTPEEGYIINKLLVDGTEVQPTNVIYKSSGEIDYYTYTFPAGGNTESDHTIHVTWQPAVTLEFEKYWDDNNDALKLRPNSIDITLSPWPTQTTDGSGNLVHGIHRNDLTSTDADYTLTSSDNWKHTYVNLPKYRNYNEKTNSGDLIVYTITETLDSVTAQCYDEIKPHVVKKTDMQVTIQYYANGTDPNHWGFDESSTAYVTKGATKRTIEYKIVNSLYTGGLVIEKDSIPDNDGIFDFTVTLTHPNADFTALGFTGTVGGTWKKTVTVNGDKLSALISGLPKGTQYTVTETVPNGWRLVQSENVTGGILDGTFYAYDIGGILYILKNGGYTGHDGAALTLPNDANPLLAPYYNTSLGSAAGTYYFDVLGAEIVQDSGSATGWKYKYGDQGDVLAEALNAGSPVKTVTYTSPSVASGLYVAYASGDIYASDTVIGTAVDRAYFQNMKVVDLTVAKNVAGNEASRDKYFKIEIELKIDDSFTGFSGGPSGYANNHNFLNELSALSFSDILSVFPQFDLNADNADRSPQGNDATVYSDMSANRRDDDTSSAGTQIQFTAPGTAVVTFYLQHGQSVTLEGLPYGVECTVKETQEDYKPGAAIQHADGTGMTGATVAGFWTKANLQKDTTVTFTNTRDGIVPTGFWDDRAPALALIGTSMLLMSVPLFGKRRRRRHG